MKTRWSGMLWLAILAAACTTLGLGHATIMAGDDPEATLARFFGRQSDSTPDTDVAVDLASWEGELAPVIKMKPGEEADAKAKFHPIDRVIETSPEDFGDPSEDEGIDEMDDATQLLIPEQGNEDAPIEVEALAPVTQWSEIAPQPLTPEPQQAHPVEPPFEPIPAEAELQNADREIFDGDRQALDAHRNWIDEQVANGDQEQSGPQPRKGDNGALSNYYGQVTVNYFVSPDGKAPRVSPANFEDGEGADGENYEVIAPAVPGTPETAPHGFPFDHPPLMPPAGCGSCGKDVCCGKKKPCLGVFGEALYLRPGSMDVLYAVEQNGCDPATSTPTGPLGIASPDIEAGFRAGLIFPVSDCASLIASYTWFQSDTNSFIEAAPGTVLSSQVTHPNIASCGANSTSASAKYDVDFQFVDLDYHHVLVSGCNWGVGATAGVRYGRLSQEFEASQDTGVATGLTTVTTDIDFDGIGVRMGLDGEYHSLHSGLFIYSKGTANFLGGQTQARYVQVNQFDPSVDIGRDYEDYRLTTILEAELGAGWQSPKGRFRTSVGFQANAWHNTLLTQAFIDGAATTDTNDDFATFSGLVGRVEFRR